MNFNLVYLDKISIWIKTKYKYKKETLELKL